MILFQLKFLRRSRRCKRRRRKYAGQGAVPGASRLADDGDNADPSHSNPDSSTCLTLLKFNSAIVDAAYGALQRVYNFVTDFALLLYGSGRQTMLLRIPIDTVNRVSIAALVAQFIHGQFLLPLSIQYQQYHQLHQQQLPPPSFSVQLSAHLLWILPALTTIVSLSLSLTMLLSWHPAETVVLAGLIALLVVECLTPLAIAGCTALFFVQALTWDSAAIMLATVWLTSAISARCIRVALYPTLGHG